MILQRIMKTASFRNNSGLFKEMPGVLFPFISVDLENITAGRQVTQHYRLVAISCISRIQQTAFYIIQAYLHPGCAEVTGFNI